MTGSEPTAQPAAPPPQAPPAPSPLDNLVAAMGMSQLLVVGGAALVVVIDLVLGVLLREYSAPGVAWAGSAAILLAYLASRRGPSLLPLKYETLVMALAAVVALVLARNFVIDVLLFLRPPVGLSATAIIGLIGYTAAGALMAWGAWQLARGRR